MSRGGGAYYLLNRFRILKTLSTVEKEYLNADCCVHVHDLSDADYAALSDSARINALLQGLDEQSERFVRWQLSLIFAARHAYLKTYLNLPSDMAKKLLSLKREAALVTQVSADSDKGGAIFTYADLKLPINFFETQVVFYRHNLEMFTRLNRTKAVLDCGACIGDSAAVFERLCGITGEIHAFEPTSRNYALMLRTIELNDLKCVVPVKLGVGSENAKMMIANSPSSNVGGSTIVSGVESNSDSTKTSGNKNLEEIEITTIDSYVARHNLEVGLIKSDVEGFEMELLKGALETIKSQRPALIISIYHNISDYLDIKPFLEDFSNKHNLGYVFRIGKGADFNVLTETCVYCEAIL